MQALYSTQELLEMELACLPRTVQNINSRAKKDHWPFRWKKGKGGQYKAYMAYLLPKYVIKAINNHEDSLALVTSSNYLPAITDQQQPISQEQQDKGMLKAGLSKLYNKAVRGAEWGNKKEARTLFMDAYNSGVDYRNIYNVLGELSYKTIEAWIRKLKKNNGNSLVLADNRGFHKKGKISLDPIQAQILVATVCQPKGKRAKSDIIIEAKARIAQKGLEVQVSDATFRRFLNNWVSTHWDEWNWWRGGKKALEDHCLIYNERDYDKINVGDILVADGHVLNFTVINPWSGKPKRMMLVLFFDMKSSMPLGWEIMPTENTQCISVALRRAILRLGKIPKSVYIDNGRAFKGEYFLGKDFDQTELPGLYQRLGIELIVAKAYHGQSKTIERFFKTFAKMEELAPTYCGTSIELKPPHLSRGEKLHTKVHEKITGGVTPTLVQTHRAIALWFDWYADQPQTANSHLAGQRPQELFDAGKGDGVDPLSLRLLMMKKECPTIRRNGVKIRDKGDFYYDPALYGRKHPVYILFDLVEPESVLVYDARTNEFICEATKLGKLHPAARILGTEVDQAELKNRLKLQGKLEKQTISYAKSIVESDVIPEVQKQIENAGFSHTEVVKDAKQLPGKKAVKAKITHLDPKQFKADLLAMEEAHHQVDDSDNDDYTPELINENDVNLTGLAGADLYEQLMFLEIRGKLSPEQATTMKFYEQTPDYELNKEWLEDSRMKESLMVNGCAEETQAVTG